MSRSSLYRIVRRSSLDATPLSHIACTRSPSPPHLSPPPLSTFSSRYASNVIETCLRKAGAKTREELTNEISVPATFSLLVQHRFGNYVVQRAISVATPEMRAKLVSLAQRQLKALKRSSVGRRIVERIQPDLDKLEEDKTGGGGAPSAT